MSGELSTPKRKLLEAQIVDAQIETEVRCFQKLQTIEFEAKQITKDVSRSFVDGLITSSLATTTSKITNS